MSTEAMPPSQENPPQYKAQIILPDGTTEVITAETKVDLIEKIKDLKESSQEN